MILLQTTVDGMSGMTFTLKDVIYICVLLGGFISGYVTLKGSVKTVASDQKTNKLSVDKDLKALTEENLNNKNGRRGLKKELTLALEKDSEVLHKRIDKTQEDFKDFRSKTDEEFKSINNKLNTISSGIGEIKGMISK